MIPVVWVVMCGQQRQHYDAVLNALKELAPDFAPRTWLSDFERQAMDAVEAAFPGCRATGCLYHLSQSIVRRIADEGLNAAYRDPQSTRPLWTRSLAALSLVPRRDVQVGFDALTRHVDFERRAVLVYEFFERVYMGRQVFGQRAAPRFSKRRWNHFRDTLAYDHAQRSNNALEGYHNRLRNLLRAHPNAFAFVRKLRSEAKRSERCLRLFAAGDQPRRRPQQVRSDRQIQRLCATYGQRDVVAHLHAIARQLKA